MTDKELVARIVATGNDVLKVLASAANHTELDDSEWLCVEQLAALVAEYDLRGLSCLTPEHIWWLNQIYEALEEFFKSE